MSRYLTIARQALEKSSHPEKPGLQRGSNQLEPQLEPQGRGSNRLEPRWSPGFSGSDENPSKAQSVPSTSAVSAPPVGGRWKMLIQLWGIDQSHDLVSVLKLLESLESFVIERRQSDSRGAADVDAGKPTEIQS